MNIVFATQVTLPRVELHCNAIAIADPIHNHFLGALQSIALASSQLESIALALSQLATNQQRLERWFALQCVFISKIGVQISAVFISSCIR